MASSHVASGRLRCAGKHQTYKYCCKTVVSAFMLLLRPEWRAQGIEALLATGQRPSPTQTGSPPLRRLRSKYVSICPRARKRPPCALRWGGGAGSFAHGAAALQRPVAVTDDGGLAGRDIDALGCLGDGAVGEVVGGDGGTTPQPLQLRLRPPPRKSTMTLSQPPRRSHPQQRQARTCSAGSPSQPCACLHSCMRDVDLEEVPAEELRRRERRFYAGKWERLLCEGAELAFTAPPRSQPRVRPQARTACCRVGAFGEISAAATPDAHELPRCPSHENAFAASRARACNSAARSCGTTYDDARDAGPPASICGGPA